jgi:signal transduction histidine kinase/ActR/RegA family two-component response regulator
MAPLRFLQLARFVRLRAPARGVHARLRAGLVVLGALVIAAFAASSGYDELTSYRHEVVSTNRELQNLAGALAEQTAWSWQGADKLLTDIARWYPSHTQLPPDQIGQFLAGRVSAVPQLNSARIIDAQGFIRDSSDPLTRIKVNVADRSYFQAQKSGKVAGVFVSEPLSLRSVRRTGVVLSRRLEDQQGGFAGIATAILDLEDLNRLYESVHLRGQLSIQLLREDGTLLASSSAPQLVGRKFAALAILSPSTGARLSDPISGEREFVTVARVPSIPLLVVVTRNEAAALRVLHEELTHAVVRTLVLALLGSLAIAALVNQLRRIEHADQALRQAQKMEALGTLAGGIAHDFNNILGAIVGYGELAQQHAPEGGALQRYLHNIMHAAGRARALVDRILGFSRTGLAERVPIHIESAVTETLELLRASLPPTIRLDTQFLASDAAVIGDETRLHQVIMNLCTNSLHAMPEGGTLSVAVEAIPLLAPRTLHAGTLAVGTYVRLTVSDTGTGIAADIVDRIFDPFFTTKPVGEGTGLGLALVHGIVADLGGAIEVQSILGKGTTVLIWLPRASVSAKPPAKETREQPRGKGEAVMIVDDEPALVALTEEMLAELGYEPVGFGSSTAALQAFQSDPGRFDAVVTDEMMPELQGTQLARAFTSVRPDLPIILTSGHGGPDLPERARLAGVSELLSKPVQKRDLALALAKALGPDRHRRYSRNVSSGS